MYRVEDKFSCGGAEMYCLRKRLESVLQSDSNEDDGGGYSVSSLYFDDYMGSCLSDTVEGDRVRRKYRIRIYNHSLDTIKLEVKEKLDNRVRKKSRTITEEELRKLMRGECIESLPSMEDPAALFNVAVQKDLLRPKLIVAYERKAYVYAPGNVRVTLDRNIRGCDRIECFGRPDISYDFLREQDEILEVKYDGFIPDFILQLLELGSMQQISYSKYQLCCERYQ
ncbi:MAG: polyphosphate polymerase domain-containing protein [Blautia sp.]|nr:polyphosphate polymerase domain-containing protein [Blautia sp.]MCM1201445.1 polyphosphate polymerase domain-containing protein [Bacteroides fragilis]